MKINEDPKIKYNSLNICGYLDDKTVEGFKVPAFKNGGMPHLQIVTESDIVISFEEYDAEDDRKIITPNSRLGDYYAVIGKPPIFLFKPALDRPIVGRKSDIVPKLRQWLSREDDIDPSVVFDVLIFINAPRKLIEQAAEKVAEHLPFKTSERREAYKNRLFRVIDSSMQRCNSSMEVQSNYIGEINSLKVQDLMDRFDQEVQNYKNYNADFYRNFFSSVVNWIATTEMKPLVANNNCIRDLVYLLNQVNSDDFLLMSGRYLIRYIYFMNIARRYMIRNNYKVSKLRYAYAMMQQKEKINILNCSSDQFLRKCLQAYSKISPQKGHNAIYVKPGTIVVGEVVDISDKLVLASSGGITFHIEENLLSAQSYYNRPILGDNIVFSVRRNNGGSCRGDIFVSQIFNLFYPFEDISSEKFEFFLGASNSWCIVKLPDRHKSNLLGGGGGFIAQLTELVGLRRMTLTTNKINSEEDNLKNFKDFVNSSWSNLRIIDFSDREMNLLLKLEDIEVFDSRKLRTFMSMANKLYPKSAIYIKLEAPNGSRTFDKSQLDFDSRVA